MRLLTNTRRPDGLLRRIVGVFILAASGGVIPTCLVAGAVAADDTGIVYRWRFVDENISERKVNATPGNLALECSTDPLLDSNQPESMILGPPQEPRFFAEAKVSMQELGLPCKELSADAWVRVDKVAEWGGAFGAIQDNGTFERGWLLGYRQSRFFFALASEKTNRLTYLMAPTGFSPGDWYHITGTWDGETQRLYIDGELVASSQEQGGLIAYSDEAHFGVGAYWDANEFHGLTGRVEQVCLWNRSLDPSEVEQQFTERKSRFPGIEGQEASITDWPTYMRDQARTGIAANTTLSWPLETKWSLQTEHAPEPAWPPPANQDFWHKKDNLKARVIFDRAYPLIAVGGRVFISSSSESCVTCLDLADGKPRWRAYAEGPVRLAPTFHDGKLLFGSDDGCVYCVDASTGRQIWRQRAVSQDRRIQGNGRIISVWPIRTDIFVQDDKAYFCAGLFPQQGVFHAALDILTGKQIAIVKINAATQGYLERRGNQLHVATGRAPTGAFLAELTRRGKPVGKAVREVPDRYPFSFVGDSSSRIFGGDGEVAAFATNTGEQVWTENVEGRVYSMAICEGNLLLSTDTGHLYCMSPVSPKAASTNTSDSNAPDSNTRGPTGLTPNSSADLRAPADEAAAVDEAAGQAKRALELAGTQQGWALILNSGDSDLAAEIAKQSQMNVVAVEEDATLVAVSRKKLTAAGLGNRVTVHQLKTTTVPLPYTDYLFNLIVDAGGVMPNSPARDAIARTEITRMTRPGGGVAIFGRGPESIVRRPSLPGTGEWNHQYATPGNSACSGDELVAGEMRLQWFGKPGPQGMMDRHHRTAAPLYSGGRLFIPGDNRVVAADAYNGTPLWNVEIADSRRAGVYRDCSYLAASPKSLFVAAASECLKLDAATGVETGRFQLPGTTALANDEWGYLATVGDLVYGSRQTYGASRRDHSLEQIKEGTYFDARPLVCSKSLFAYSNRPQGAPKWEYHPLLGLIVNSTIAIDSNRISFIESGAIDRNSSSGRHKLSQLLAEPAYLTTLDSRTGELQWQKKLPLGHMEHVLYLVASGSKLVLAGSYNQDTGTGNQVHFDITTFDVRAGEVLWTKTQKQGGGIGGSHGEQDLHPVVVGEKLYCEPFAYHLNTGEPLENWKWNPAHRRGCGTISASASSFFFRQANPTMFDLDRNEYSKVTTTTRPGCWINMLPAGGLLLVPEASSGCTCNFAIQSSMAFLPVAVPPIAVPPAP